MEQTCETSCECGSGQSSDQCCQSSCNQYDHFTMMVWVAKEAKMELFKEKVKKKIDAAHGKKLDKLSDVIVEAITEKMKHQQEALKRKQELRDKFYSILNEE